MRRQSDRSPSPCPSAPSGFDELNVIGGRWGQANVVIEEAAVTAPACDLTGAAAAGASRPAHQSPLSQSPFIGEISVACPVISLHCTAAMHPQTPRLSPAIPQRQRRSPGSRRRTTSSDPLRPVSSGFPRNPIHVSAHQCTGVPVPIPESRRCRRPTRRPRRGCCDSCDRSYGDTGRGARGAGNLMCARIAAGVGEQR